MSEARGGWSEASRRLIAAWPLTLGVAVLALLLLAGATAWLTRSRATAPAVVQTPSPAASPAPPAAPAPEAGGSTAASEPPPLIAEAPAAADPTLAAAGLAGEWTAEDADTRSLTRVVVREEGEDTFVHVWGRCHPTDCDWGEATADAELDRPKPRLSATYEPGFATEALSLRLVRPGLIAYRVETDFTDGSGCGHQVSEGLLQRKGG